VAAFLVYMALLGGARHVLGDGVGIAAFVVMALALSTALWWFTAWLMLKGQVRLRVLLPSGLITAIALPAHALSATLWMPDNVTSNDHQCGIFGVALAQPGQKLIPREHKTGRGGRRQLGADQHTPGGLTGSC